MRNIGTDEKIQIFIAHSTANRIAYRRYSGGKWQPHRDLWHSGNFPVVMEAITLTVDIADLQATLNDLPKYLRANVTINVNKGTYSGNITVSGFLGTGTLTIKGASAVATTHNVSKIIIQNCSIPYLNVVGFGLTTTSGNAMYFYRNGGTDIDFQYMSATAGSSSTTNFYGAYASASKNVAVRDRTITNKYSDCQKSPRLRAFCDIIRKGDGK